MEPLPAHRRTSRPTPRRATVAAAGALLLAAASLASAASSSIGDCGRMARHLQSLDVDHEALSLAGVEHMVVDEQRNFDVPPGAPILDADVVSPVLRLTPRVASILREVFGSEIIVTVEDAGTADDTTEDASSTPPLAREESAAPPPGAAAPGLRDDSGHRYMPRFQRHMYRTDI